MIQTQRICIVLCCIVYIDMSQHLCVLLTVYDRNISFIAWLENRKRIPMDGGQ